MLCARIQKNPHGNSDICDLLVEAWSNPDTMNDVLKDVVTTMNADLAEERE